MGTAANERYRQLRDESQLHHELGLVGQDLSSVDPVPLTTPTSHGLGKGCAPRLPPQLTHTYGSRPGKKALFATAPLTLVLRSRFASPRSEELACSDGQSSCWRGQPSPSPAWSRSHHHLRRATSVLHRSASASGSQRDSCHTSTPPLSPTVSSPPEPRPYDCFICLHHERVQVKHREAGAASNGAAKRHKVCALANNRTDVRVLRY